MRSFAILHPMFDFGYGESAAVPAHVSVPNRIGLAFAGLSFLVKGPVGLGAGLLSGWLRARPGVLACLHRASGAVLLGPGVELAFEPRP